jgi:hypothetical protein
MMTETWIPQVIEELRDCMGTAIVPPSQPEKL